MDDGLVGIDNVETHLEGALAAEVVQHPLEQVRTVLEGVDCQRVGALQQGHGGYQSRQPEAVVAVQVADEYVVQAHQLEAHASDAQLRALAAVDHHQVVTHVEHLARRLVARRHRRAPASQYVQFQSCH